MFDRRLASWLLALALILGQAAAFAHALDHIDLHDTAAADAVCEVCVAQAQLGSAVPPTPVAWALAADQAVPAAITAPARASTPYRSASARAPPAPSHV